MGKIVTRSSIIMVALARAVTERSSLRLTILTEMVTRTGAS
jgi:hypothetical protein